MGVLKFYCNREWATSHLNRLYEDAVASSPRKRRTRPLQDRKPKKLPARVHEEIVDSYKHGLGVNELASRLGVSKATVITHLNKADVKRRPRSMSEGQIEEAVGSYEGGLSLAKIGDQLGFNARTVQLRLRERGVRFRDTHGRDR